MGPHSPPPAVAVADSGTGARAGNVPDFSGTTEGSLGSSDGCRESGRGINRSALHLGQATTVPAFVGATARSWLHR